MSSTGFVNVGAREVCLSRLHGPGVVVWAVGWQCQEVWGALVGAGEESSRRGTGCELCCPCNKETESKQHQV